MMKCDEKKSMVKIHSNAPYLKKNMSLMCVCVILVKDLGPTTIKYTLLQYSL